jgi:hypothetical protein
MPSRSEVLIEAWQDLDITVDDFWISYVTIGGERLPANIEELLAGTWEPSPREYNLLAHALNEVNLDRGGDHPVPYWD